MISNFALFGRNLLLSILLAFSGNPTLIAGDAAALSPDEAFESANNDFRRGDFTRAAEKYESLVHEGYFSKSLFFNLATAFYRSDSFGKSLLWLRRARVLDPDMPEVRQDLEFLRTKIGFLEFSSSKPDRILLAIPPALLSWLTASSLWAIGFALVILIFIRKLDRFRGLLITGTGFAFLLAGASLWAGKYRSTNLAVENFATIIAADAKALTAPTPDAKSIMDLPPGSEVRTLQNADHWTYVEVPGDLRGWVRTEKLEPIWPIAPPVK